RRIALAGQATLQIWAPCARYARDVRLTAPIGGHIILDIIVLLDNTSAAGKLRRREGAPDVRSRFCGYLRAGRAGSRHRSLCGCGAGEPLRDACDIAGGGACRLAAAI